MEHLFHIFGGGCGEHMLLPGLASAGVALTMARHHVAVLWRKCTRRGSDTPAAE